MPLNNKQTNLPKMLMWLSWQHIQEHQSLRIFKNMQMGMFEIVPMAIN